MSPFEVKELIEDQILGFQTWNKYVKKERNES